MSSIALETPLAEALSNAVHSKIVEEGWTQDDDTSLAEYIVLMLANGKTQDQIASELAGELLQDAKGTTEFAQWLFDQVNALSSGTSGASAPNAAPSQSQPSVDVPEEEPSEWTDSGNASIPAAYDTDMGDNAPDNAPKGPKSLHGGRANSRGGRGSASKQGGDSALHRVRGNDRVNSHVRGAPKGPRSISNQAVRPGMQKALNGMGMTGPGQGMQPPMMPNGAPGQPPMLPSPQQQMDFLAMMEQGAKYMAQMGMMQSGMFQGGQNGAQQQFNQGRSLFDRVESGRGRGGARGRGRGGAPQHGAVRSGSKTGDADTSMDEDGQSTEASSGMNLEQRKPNDPSMTMCHFNKRCKNTDCPYVHQSPAAPDGVVVDMSDTCTFGAACKNAKCVGRHPSPAQIRAHQAEEFCKFWPDCAKGPACPFKHPTAPLCAYGASCKNKECPFTHLQTPCRFNPCINAKCPYKHEPGQNRALTNNTWTPEMAKHKEEQEAKEHVSDRRFVAEDAGEEELIKPGQNGGVTAESNGNGQAHVQEEVIT